MDWIQVFTIIGVITAMIGLSTTGLYFAIRRNADEIRSIRSEMIAIRSEMKDGFKHIQISIGEVDRALNDLNRAIQLDPNNHEFLKTLDAVY